MKKYLLAGFLLCLSLATKAQTIVGNVVDEQNLPVSFANVVLCSLPDSTFMCGTVTNEQGQFTLNAAGSENKLLQVSYIGYEKMTLPCNGGNVGTLRLKPDAVMIGETVVTGHRPTYALKGSSLTTNVSGSLLSTLGTGNDVLRRIPGIQMNHDKSIEVFGKGTPLIYINGRLVRDNSELDQLSSKDIAEVELITSPGAAYDAEVKSVLRIKTVKPVGEGLGGYVRASGDYASGWEHTEQANLNYRKGKFDLFGSVMHAAPRVEQTETIELQMQGKQLWDIRNQTRIESNQYRFLAVQGGVNYQFDANNSIGVNYGLNRLPYSGSVDGYQDYEVFRDGQSFDQSQAHLIMTKRVTNHKANFYYNGKWGEKLGVDFNFDVVSGRSDNNQSNNETSAEQEDRIVTSLGKADYQLYAGKLLFSYPLGRGTLSVGAEANKTDHNDSYFNEQEIVPGAVGQTTEEKLAGFASYQIGWGKTSLNAGLRYEHTSFNYYIDSERQDDQSRRYNNVFPNVSFSFPVRNFRNSLNYTVKTLRPRYDQLDGNVQYSNRYMYKQGNSLLKPETMRDVSFMSGYKFINFSLSYQYVKNYINAERTLYNEEGSISISRDVNASKNERLNLMLSVSPKVSWWQPAFNVYFTQQFFKAQYQGKTMNYNNPVAYFTLNNDFTLPARYILSLTGNYNTAGSSGSMQLLSSGAVNVGLRKSWFNERLMLNLNGYDLFHTSRKGGTHYSPSCMHTYEDTFNSRKVELSVSFRFNASQSKYKGTGAANDEIKRL